MSARAETGATIRVVRRTARYRDALGVGDRGSMYVWIDGRRCERLALLAATRIAVSPGVHQVRVGAWWPWWPRSDLVTVAPGAGEIASLLAQRTEIGPGAAGVDAVMAWRRPWTLEHVHGGDRPPQRA